MSGIRISPKHGVNPSLMICFFCGEDKGVALLGALPGDKEAPRKACFDKEPCDKCKVMMEYGVILISVQDGEEGKEDPYRTGGWVVLKPEAIERLVNNPELVERILKQRVCFVPDQAWDLLGLPRGKAEAQ